MEKIKCRVCGFEWTPTKEDHYTARADEKARILINDHCEPALYDAWDCPVCGAQFAVEGRKRTVEEEPEGLSSITISLDGQQVVTFGGGGHKNPYEDLDAQVQEDCEGCEHFYGDAMEYPCNRCCRNYYDKYTEAKKDGAE